MLSTSFLERFLTALNANNNIKLLIIFDLLSSTLNSRIRSTDGGKGLDINRTFGTEQKTSIALR